MTSVLQQTITVAGAAARLDPKLQVYLHFLGANTIFSSVAASTALRLNGRE